MISLSSYNQLGTHERIVRAKNGALMRVCFEVSEINGSIRGRIISVQPILTLKGKTDNFGNHYFLPFSITQKVISGSKIFSQKIVSPYSNLLFFTSQMTRAPAF